MLFNSHSDLVGKHAFLSPSQPSWLNYDEQKLDARFFTVVASRRGVDLHDLAHKAITLGVRFHHNNKALANYVTDGIKYRMLCEQPLVYSDNAFGTCDTISFNPRTKKLRIHDLKTGIHPASMRQLEIYAAYFCLEYGLNPYEIDIELRIYQREEVTIHHPEPELIDTIMEKTVYFDHLIQQKKEELW